MGPPLGKLTSQTKNLFLVTPLTKLVTHMFLIYKENISSFISHFSTMQTGSNFFTNHNPCIID